MYTFVKPFGNKMAVAHHTNGVKKLETVEYKPSLFVNDAKVKNSKYTDIHSNPVRRIEFDGVKSARKFYRDYCEVGDFKIFGMEKLEYAWIADNYPGEIDYDLSQLNIINIDIEVLFTKGFTFRSISNIADSEVSAVTCKYKNTYYVFGTKPYNNTRKDVKYFLASNETELLQLLIKFWEWAAPDIVSGFNVFGFDMPYLVNRTKILLGDDWARRFSPLKFYFPKELDIKKRKYEGYDLYGLTILDTMLMYKKFVPGELESYSLENIAQVELGMGKLDYSNEGSLTDLYNKDYQKYIDYNIRDVDLVDRIEESSGLMASVLALAYKCKVNFYDVFYQTRNSDSLMFNVLMEKGIVVPPGTHHNTKSEYEGAYIKNPVSDVYKWVASFDLNSQYPMTTVQYNISPETIINGQKYDITVDDIVDGKIDHILKEIKEQGVSLAASGCTFTKEKKGFVPEVIDTMYNERVTHKVMAGKANVILDRIEHELKTRGVKLDNA